jgi:hypothetical protein
VGDKIMFHRPLRSSRKGRRDDLSFFFAAETPAKKKIMPFGRRVAVCEILTRSASTFPFLPSQQKREKVFLCVFCDSAVNNVLSKTLLGSPFKLTLSGVVHNFQRA